MCCEYNMPGIKKTHVTLRLLITLIFFFLSLDCCQGSAADMAKIAMVNIAKQFESKWKDYHLTSLQQSCSASQSPVKESSPSGAVARGLTAPHIALQIHDELVIELPEEDLANVQASKQPCFSLSLSLSP